ncbi:MAG TPA: tetratricopeptide repeat protein [Casimicrobiaceae bacterium]
MNGVDGDRTALTTLRSLVGGRQFREARLLAERLLAENPHDSECLFLLGIVQAEQKQFSEALGNIRRALETDPNPHWTKHLALTNVLRDAGDALAAEAAARQLIEQAPDNVQALNALGLALHDQRRDEEASATFHRAIALDPRYVAAYLNAALSLQRRGDDAAAISVIEQGLSRDPSNGQLALAMGRLVEQTSRRDEAKTWYVRAARLDPRIAADAYRRLGRLFYGEADIFASIGAYEQAVKLRNDNADVWNLLGNAYMDVAAIDNATRCYRAALSINPGYAEVFDNLLLCHHYDPLVDADGMFAAHKEWARRFAANVGVQSGRPRRSLRSSDRIRVGFLSQSLCAGPTGFFLLPLIRHLDAARFESFGYHAGPKRDEVTEALRRHAASWNDVGADDDERLAQRIQQDQIDILVDLAGHAPGNRLRAIARKPAPVVVSWLDYFNTTGLDCVDFLIGDSVSIPVDTRQRFTETVLRIEPSRLCYAPPDYAPPPVPPPMLRNGYPTFGSFNRLAKLAEPVVDLWARLLDVVPRSRLLLKSAAFNHPATSKSFATRFEQRGIAADRLELRGNSSHSQMLAEYADVDIALDPFPYNGGLTTCEALWMGVPVVALLGDSMISRQSAALLMSAGLAHWVARTADEWLAIVSELALQSPNLAEIRRSLRPIVASSPLVDGGRFADRFGALLEQMWRTRGATPG